MTLLTENDQHLFEVQVYLDDLEPDAVRVELFANGIEGNGSERIEMKPVRNLLGAVNGFDCQAQVQAMRPASDYTARLIPQHDGASGRCTYSLAAIVSLSPLDFKRWSALIKIDMFEKQRKQR